MEDMEDAKPQRLQINEPIPVRMLLPTIKDEEVFQQAVSVILNQSLDLVDRLCFYRSIWDET